MSLAVRPWLPSHACSERRVGVEIDAVKFVHAGGDREQHRACAVADLERLGVAAIGDHPQSEVDPFAKESPDKRTLVVRDRIGWTVGHQTFQQARSQLQIGLRSGC